MKKIMSVILAVIVAVLSFIASLPKRYIDRAGIAHLFSPAARRVQAMGVCLANRVKDATITVTQSASGTFSCAIQLLGENGADLTTYGAVAFFLSIASTPTDICADGTDTTEIAIGTDGLLVEEATDVSGILVSEVDGEIDLTVTVAASKVAYLQIILPDGHIVSSDAMTYGM